MTLTPLPIVASCAGLIFTIGVLITSCSNEVVKGQTASVTSAADGGAGPLTDSLASGEFLAPAQLRCATRAFARGRSCCGSCGGVYRHDGTCSIQTPPNLGSACDLGSGKGACANGGTIVCGGACQAAHPAIGDATAWHLKPSPTGSWDWDCDGAVTTTLHRSSIPPDCATFTESKACEAAAAIEYLAEDAPCGQQATLFMRDCGWKTLGPTCLNAAAGHRVVFSSVARSILPEYATE